MLSENLTAGDVRDYLNGQGFIGAGGGRFFINGVDTETQGIDVVVNWPVETGARPLRLHAHGATSTTPK